MSLFPRTASLHEPAPDFTEECGLSLVDPKIADRFLLEQKLPAISAYASFETYCETSHMWCFGLVQSWLRLEIVPTPDAIVLDRDLRLIASSIYQLGITPGQDRWIIDPLSSGCILGHETPENWTRYHACYAYCLEVEARKDYISRLVKQAGGRIVRIKTDELSTWQGILRLKSELSLRVPRPAQLYTYLFLKKTKVNTKSSFKTNLAIPELSFEEMTRCENEVKAAVCLK